MGVVGSTKPHPAWDFTVRDPEGDLWSFGTYPGEPAPWSDSRYRHDGTFEGAPHRPRECDDRGSVPFGLAPLQQVVDLLGGGLA